MRTVVVWIALLCVLLFIGGCKEEKTAPVSSAPFEAGRVEITLAHDTLYFYAGQTGIDSGTVTVYDTEGRAMPGAVVELANEYVGFGSVTFTGSDTTDIAGRVSFQYHVTRETGYDVISAHCGRVTCLHNLFFVVRNVVLGRITVSLDPDTIFVHHWGEEDSVLATLCVYDTSGHGVQGISMALQNTGGRHGPLPPTDSTGCCSFYWSFLAEGQPVQCVSIGTAGVSDSACVTVIYDIPSRPLEPAWRDSL